MTVSNWRAVGKKALIGTFDIDIPSGFSITGAMLLESAGRQWVNFPSIPQYTKTGDTYAPLMKDGKQVYKNVLSIPDRDRRDKFSELAIAALQDMGVI